VSGVDRHATWGGLNFRYREWGDASDPPLVFLHGAFVASVTYDSLLGDLAAAAGRRVIALDQRGHGATDHTTDYSWERWVDDVDAFADHLGLERFELAGHSMGAFNASRYAGRHPTRVSALVLIDGGFAYESGDNPEYWGRVMSLFPEDGWSDVDSYVDRVCGLFPRTEPAVLRNGWQFFEPGDDGRYRWPYEFDPAMLGQADPDDDSERSLRRAVTCPVLVAKGEFSELAPGDGYLVAAAEHPNGTPAVLAGAGHNVCFENVAGTVARIAEFLGDPSVISDGRG
jgi:esterase